ncbi:VIR protein [Plasmodium vivax]|uniref:VIR protein n=1 Tax=Plasmodium vivax TaxID=5855 RepID=A0A1G4E0W8_PLAVI|nr:VIR protein [Plasmodium vivax]
MSYPCLDYYKDEAHVASKVFNILKDFPLYDFYNKLHNEVTNVTTTDKRCALCTVNLTRTKQEQIDLLNLCQNFCHILLNFDHIKTVYQKISSDKRCTFTSYWLYDQVTKIPNFSSLSSKFYDPFPLISKHSHSKIKDCSLENYRIDKNKFTHKKILYEFLHIYDSIQDKLNSQEDVSKIQLYCMHIKENFRYYNIIKESCKSKGTCDYYDEYKQFKEKFKEPKVINLICEKCDYIKTSCEKGSNGEDDVPCLREKGYSFLYLIFGNDADNIINIILKVTTISVPILVFSVILFKFTPLGKSLNKLKQERKKSGRKKKEENIQDYMKNYAAYLDSEMKNRVHLGYHAT